MLQDAFGFVTDSVCIFPHKVFSPLNLQPYFETIFLNKVICYITLVQIFYCVFNYFLFSLQQYYNL